MPQHYKKVTEFVVCGTIGVALFFVLFSIAPWYVAGALSLYLAYESWTLVNSRPNDTISDIMWELSERPNVPFLFGCASTGMIALGWFGPWKQALLCAGWFYLQGHFFFQKKEN